MSKIENQPTDDLNEPDDNKPQQARQQLIAQTALNIHPYKINFKKLSHQYHFVRLAPERLNLTKQNW